MRKAACALMVASALLGARAPAFADEPSAQSLFDAATAAMRNKNFAAACPAFRKSFRLDARPETLYNVARCEDEAGHFTTAAAAYDDYLALHDTLSEADRRAESEREHKAVGRRAVLEPLIPHVTFSLGATPPDGVRATRRPADGGDPVDVALGVPLPIDPGDHFVATEAPDRPRWEQRFSVKPGDRVTINLKVAPPDNSKASRFNRPIAPVPTMLPPLEPGPSAQRVSAYVIGGIGIAGILTGAITGAIVWGQKGSIDANCKMELCNATGQTSADLAKNLGVVSTASFVVGGVALATGVILYLTEPAKPKLGAIPSRMMFGLNATPGGASAVTTWTW